jgi:hypothetical protein
VNVATNTNPPPVRCGMCGGRCAWEPPWIHCRRCSWSSSARRRVGLYWRARVALALPSWHWWRYLSPLSTPLGVIERVRVRVAHKMGRHVWHERPVGDRVCNWCGERDAC